MFLPLCWSLPTQLCKVCLTHHFLPRLLRYHKEPRTCIFLLLSLADCIFPQGLILSRIVIIIASLSFLCTIISFFELAIFKNYIKIRLHGHKAKRFGKGNKGLADTKGQKAVAREARHSRIRLSKVKENSAHSGWSSQLCNQTLFYQPRVIMVKK